MRILVIAGYYPPEQCADTRLNKDLVESLAEQGEEVKLLVPFPNRGITEVQQKDYLERKHEIVKSNFEIYRIGKPKKYKQSIILRGISFLKKSFDLYRIAKKETADICLVISTPPTLGYIAALLSKKKKVVYKLQDAFPDSLQYSRSISEKSILMRLLRRLERWVYNSVQEIITISDDLKGTLVNRGVAEEKIRVIYDWIDEKKCYPISKNDNFLFDKFELDRSKFYISYAGNIGQLQNVGTIIRASEMIDNEDIQFVIIGNGSCKEEIDRILSERPHTNVHCYPLQPEKDIAYIYSLGDVGLVSLKPDVTKLALPSKTWDIMSSGRVVLCEIDLYSKLCKIVVENQCGVCVAPNDAEEMAKAIKVFYENRQQTIEMGKKGREYILNNLTREAAVQKYINVFKSIVEG